MAVAKLGHFGSFWQGCDHAVSFTVDPISKVGVQTQFTDENSTLGFHVRFPDLGLDNLVLLLWNSVEK